jgi:hypothetical protein
MKILSRNQQKDFARDGFLHVPGFYDVDELITPIHSTLASMIEQVAKRHNLPEISGRSSTLQFDSGYRELIATDRSFGAEVYDLAKQVPGLYRIVGDSRHAELFRELRPESIPAVAHGGYGIRIDNPFEDTFRAEWHQEYPAQLRSPNGLVFWSPLVPVTAELGPVQIAVGSHREGPLPVFQERSGKRQGAYALRLVNESEVVEKYEVIAPLLEPGDLLIMDFMLLHCSGRNSGTRARWSMQFRYFDLSNPIGRRNGWLGSFAEGVDFSKVHPELLVMNVESNE